MKQTKYSESSTQHRQELLTLLKPDLPPEIAAKAGNMLDAVASYLEDSGPTRLFDAQPPLTFDPLSTASYDPEPLPIPATGQSERQNRKPDMELPWLSGQSLAKLVQEGNLSRAEVLEHFKKRIGEWNPRTNAFLEVTLNSEAPLLSGHPLFEGVPIGLQDLISVAGLRTTAGSRILKDYVPTGTAVCWEKLSSEGATLAGKLNTQEFAAGTTGENSHYGGVRNPWDTTRLAGGAAGGAGAAVATGMVSAAIGTDPGGSIRVPAAHCGVVSLKPTFGTMNRQGVIPLTSTTETLGVISATTLGTAEVCDLLLDGRGATKYGASCTVAAKRGRVNSSARLRIGVPTNWLEMGVEDGVMKSYKHALDELVELGASIHEIELPDAAHIAPVHRAIAFSEASSIHEELLRDHSSEYGEEIRVRQEAGRGVMASEYLKAQRLRGRFCRQFSEVWRDVDIIATPTSPVPAAPIGTATISTGSRGEEPIHSVYTRYAAPLSSLGLPALSIPCGFADPGLPVGLQLCGPPHSEPLLFYTGAAYESVTPWHLQHPQISESS